MTEIDVKLVDWVGDELGDCDHVTEIGEALKPVVHARYYREIAISYCDAGVRDVRRVLGNEWTNIGSGCYRTAFAHMSDTGTLYKFANDHEYFRMQRKEFKIFKKVHDAKKPWGLPAAALWEVIVTGLSHDIERTKDRYAKDQVRDVRLVFNTNAYDHENDRYTIPIIAAPFLAGDGTILSDEGHQMLREATREFNIGDLFGHNYKIIRGIPVIYDAGNPETSS